MYNACVVITADCLLRLIFSIKEFHINFAVDLVYIFLIMVALWNRADHYYGRRM